MAVSTIEFVFFLIIHSRIGLLWTFQGSLSFVRRFYNEVVCFWVLEGYRIYCGGN